MSLEAVEKLLQRLRATENNYDPTYADIADELEAALVAEGQDAAPKTPYSLHCAEIRRKAIEETLEIYIKAFEQDWVVQDCIDAIKRLAAAAPSLHKEGKEGPGASVGDLLPCGHTRDNWHEGYLSTSKPGESHGPKTNAHCRACAALHKEGRCKVTGNPCGTDTWMAGWPCQCESCQTWAALHKEGAGGERLTGTQVLAAVNECVDLHGIGPDFPATWVDSNINFNELAESLNKRLRASPAGRAEQEQK